MLEMPAGCSTGPWPCTTVRGLGERVGDVAIGDGDGVRARGDSGML